MRVAALSVQIMDFASLDHERLNVRRKALGLGIIFKTTTKSITLIACYSNSSSYSPFGNCQLWWQTMSMFGLIRRWCFAAKKALSRKPDIVIELVRSFHCCRHSLCRLEGPLIWWCGEQSIVIGLLFPIDVNILAVFVDKYTFEYFRGKCNRNCLWIPSASIAVNITRSQASGHFSANRWCVNRSSSQ